MKAVTDTAAHQHSIPLLASLHEFTPRIEWLVRRMREPVDVVVLAYDSAGVSADEHVQHIAGGIAGRSPAFVLVLSC